MVAVRLVKCNSTLLGQATHRSLGGKPGTAYWIAPRPKGMWQRTYVNMCAEIDWCEHQAKVSFIASFEHVLSDDRRKMISG